MSFENFLAFLKLAVFTLAIAFTVAKLEINIEGKEGWGKNLPTWRVKNWFTKIFFGEQELTGYHVWFFATALIFLHFPYVLGIDFSFSTEAKILAVFLFGMILEDIFWFMLNPHFGIKKLNKFHAHWHKHWFGFLPRFYIYYGLAGCVLLASSLLN